MFQNQLASSSSCSETLQGIEADIHHANTLAMSVQKAYGGVRIQMRLSYSSFAPVLLFLLRWLDYTCVYSLPSYLGLHVLVHKVRVDGKRKKSYERRASLREFYGSFRVYGSCISLRISNHMFNILAGIIYPSLEQLESGLMDIDSIKEKGKFGEIVGATNADAWWSLPNKDSDQDDECGICMEVCTKMVLPNCRHSMCINCYRDWNMKSQSCPFCRDSLKRVASRDLWVLMGDGDVVDSETLVHENLQRFYRYIDKLPPAIPDSLFMVYYEYLV